MPNEPATPGTRFGPETLRALKVLLRFVGSMELLALVAVFMPRSYMDATHRVLGMGPLPSEPVVGYLARTVSLFYALQGGLLWWVSFDPPHHRSVLRYMSWAYVLFGLITLGIDLLEGMPGFWVAGEGPVVILIGALMLLLRPRPSPASSPMQADLGILHDRS